MTYLNFGMAFARVRLFRQNKKHTLMRTPITYWGGKQSLAARILTLIPPHTTYVEPFFGGGAVFFQKAKSHVEVINDLNRFVVNFYQQARDNFPALQKRIRATLEVSDLKFTAERGARENTFLNVKARLGDQPGFYLWGMEKVAIPKRCSLAYGLSTNCLYLQFFTQQEAEDFYASMPTPLQEAVNRTHNGVFIDCAKHAPSAIFELPERGLKGLLFPNDNVLAPSRALEELQRKGWKYRSENEKRHDFVLNVDGYRDYWLDFDEEISEWRLKQFGMGMSICSFRSLGEREIEAIFRLCSQHAKKW